MTEREWREKAGRLRQALRVARQGVYHGQREEGKEEAYRTLRRAEDDLRLHLDNNATLVS